MDLGLEWDSFERVTDADPIYFVGGVVERFPIGVKARNPLKLGDVLVSIYFTQNLVTSGDR
jgi:hypothetical protein